MSYVVKIICPVCEDGEVTVKYQQWPGTYEEPPEEHVEVIEHTCACSLEDHMDENPLTYNEVVTRAQQELPDLDYGPEEEGDRLYHELKDEGEIPP